MRASCPAILTSCKRTMAQAFIASTSKPQPEAVRGTINQWVEQQTNNKIQNLIGPGMLTPLTRLVLTNAIYFKGTWQHPFEKAATQDGEFHLSAAQTATVPLMHRTGSGYRYYDGGTFQELELPYDGDLAMVVLLPKTTDGLPALEQPFTAHSLHKTGSRSSSLSRRSFSPSRVHHDRSNSSSTARSPPWACRRPSSRRGGFLRHDRQAASSPSPRPSTRPSST